MDQKTILIVDDEEMTLMLTENILSKQYHTLRASSGEEAIEMYDKHRPDMVLADYLMPGMNGFEMLDAMKTRFGRRVPVIFMTASEDEETEFQSLGHGALEFIRKPLKAGVLLQTIGASMARIEKMRSMG